MDKLLPPEYAYLWQFADPPMIPQAVNLFGVTEVPGKPSNNEITDWAREITATPEVGGWLEEFYEDDSIPWCGLWMAVVAVRAGGKAFNKCLSARAWADWGDPATRPRLGDVLVFWRGRPEGTSGHVGLYVGETKDGKYFHVLGGNQGDEVSIVKIPAYRLLAVRRQPGVRFGPVIKLDGGKATQGEA